MACPVPASKASTKHSVPKSPPHHPPRMTLPDLGSVPMCVNVRAARPGDGAGISRAWMSAAKYYAVGWLAAWIEEPIPNASAQLTREPGWVRLVVDALVVQQEHWRHGVGGALLDAAETWRRSRGAHVARLDTYIGSPVSVPFYEDCMGYERRAIVFQKQF
jgi:GNAT superfamily N-acetyltransferase